MGDKVSDGNDTGEDWCVPCSDEEITDPLNWEPSAAEIIELYNKLEKKETLGLEWECPLGRRPPSVHANEMDENESSSQHEVDANKPIEPNDFDFEDDDNVKQITTPKIQPRRRQALTSSTKRVASFDKVMLDIERYRKLDELELRKESASPTLVKKTEPKVPTSAAEQKTS